MNKDPGEATIRKKSEQENTRMTTREACDFWLNHLGDSSACPCDPGEETFFLFFSTQVWLPGKKKEPFEDEKEADAIEIAHSEKPAV